MQELPREHEEVHSFDLESLCLGCFQCSERGLSCSFTNRMENRTKLYLPQKCKTDRNLHVEAVAEMSDHTVLLSAFPNKCSNVVANDVELQVCEGEWIGCVVPLL